MFGNPIIFLKGAENIGAVLSKEHQNVKGYWPRSTKILLGDCIGNLDDPYHRQRYVQIRKIHVCYSDVSLMLKTYKEHTFICAA